MRDFILLMHDDANAETSAEMWSSYLSFLRGRGVFEGGSSIGSGETFRKQAPPGDIALYRDKPVVHAHMLSVYFLTDTPVLFSR